MRTSTSRSRWAAFGAALAVTAGLGGIGFVRATTPSDATAYVPIAPCRLFDTRPAPLTVGTRSTPWQPAESATVQVTGTNGDCTIPSTATAVVVNMTGVGPTERTFVTAYPAGTSRPNASNLNMTAGQAPTPNLATIRLSAGGAMTIYNNAGTINLIADVNGYYAGHTHDDRYYTEGELDARLAAPVADVVAVPAVAFTPRYPASTDYVIGSGAQLYATAASVDDTFVAPVQLPDGAVLDEMAVSMWDDSTTSLEVRLYRVRFDGPVFETIYAVASSGDAAVTQIVSDSVAPVEEFRTVDNSAYTYLLWVSCPGSWAGVTSELRLHGVTISVTR